MKKYYQRRKKNLLAGVWGMALMLLSAFAGYAQSDNLTPNVLTSTPVVPLDFDNLTVDFDANSSTLGNASWAGCGGNGNCPARVVDQDITNFARVSLGGAVGATASAWLRVIDGNDIYEGNYYAGFKIRSSSLSLLGGALSLKVSTLLDGVEQDSKTITNSIFLVSLGGDNYEIGLFTDKDFDAVQIDFNYTAGVIGTNTFDVYHAVLRSYEAPATGPECNIATTLTSPTYPVTLEMDRTGTTGFVLGAFNNPEYAIDSDPNTAATINTTISLGSSVNLSVRDVVTSYPGGTFAGFDIGYTSLLDLDVLSDITITTYLDGAYQEDFSGNNLVVGANLLTVNRYTIGFVTANDKPFNEVRISFATGLTINLSATSIYGFSVVSFCDLTSLSCNTLTRLTSPDFPVVINSPRTGVNGTLLLNSQIENAESLLDPTATSPARIVLTAGALASGSISVKKGASNFPAEAFVGFDITRPLLADVGLLQGVTVRTFLNGVATPDVVDENSLISINSSILSGISRRTVGFIPQHPFDEIQITVEQTGLNIGTTEVHSLVIQEFCEPDDPLACNTLTPVVNPEHPVYVNARNTGVDALFCAACSINNTENLVDGAPDSYASVVLATGLLVDAGISVANALQPYAAGSFAGFEIATQTLLSADVLSAIEINLYNNGGATPVQSVSGAGLLLSATSSILDGGGTLNRQLIGIVANTEFDEVQILFRQPVSLDLGTIYVYNAVISNSCSDGISCNSSYYLSLDPDGFPAYINSQRTGVSGAVGALGGVRDAWNVVKPNNDYARIGVQAGAIGNTSLSVVDALNTYPAGTYAGFTVGVDASIAQVELFSSIVITTYLDGIRQESSSVGNLVDLELIGIPILGPGSGTYNVGFATQLPFDEIQITARNLVNVDLLNDIRVYGAFVDTRQSFGGSLSCRLVTNPDMNAGYINQEISGNVSTNDINKTGGAVTYGPVTAMSGNPTTGIPTLNSNGTYTFQSGTVGVYTFEVPACKEGQQASDCTVETLTITLLNPTVTTNPPVVNPDLVVTTGDDDDPSPVVINVRANDGPGNPGGELGTPTISTQPANGSATVDGNGNVVYTPDPGFYGEDTFVYEVCEGEGAAQQCGTAEVKVTVTHPGAGGMVAASDDYKMAPNSGQLSVDAAAGVLANDSDSEGGTLTATLLSPATISGVGTLTLSGNGSYTFQPSAGFTGSANFTYEACNANDNCATATLYLTIYDPTPLPVVLSRFKAIKEGELAHLSWSTTEELNSERFEVERSFEARSWHQLDVIAASGNSNILRNYSFTDTDPSEGINYYRLKMVDRDGTFKYSPVESLRFENISGISISPNPAAERVSLTGKDMKNVEKIELLSVTGQVLYRLTSGSLSDEINIRGLPAGIYIISVTKTGGRISTHKLMKN